MDADDRVERLARIRAQRERRLTIMALRNAAGWIEKGLPAFMMSVCRSDRPELPQELRERLDEALDDLELGEDGAVARVARLLRHAAEHLELTAPE